MPRREQKGLSKNAKRRTKTQEECAKRKKTDCDCKTTKQQIKTLDQTAKCKKTMRDQYNRQ